MTTPTERELASAHLLDVRPSGPSSPGYCECPNPYRLSGREFR